MKDVWSLFILIVSWLALIAYAAALVFRTRRGRADSSPAVRDRNDNAADARVRNDKGRALLVALMMIATARPAEAQNWKKRVAMMALDHVAMTVDVWTTRRVIAYGGVELDPRWKWASHSDWMYLDAQIEPLILDIFWLKVKKHRSKAILSAVTGGLVSVHSYNAIHNYRLGTRLAEEQFQRATLRPPLNSIAAREKQIPLPSRSSAPESE